MEDYKTDTFINKIDLNLSDIFVAKCSRAVVDLNRSRQSLDESMFPVKESPIISTFLCFSSSNKNLQFGKTTFKS